MSISSIDFLLLASVTVGTLAIIFYTKPSHKKLGILHARGIRNNNPLNIKYYRGTEWLGSETHKDGEKFVVFKSPEYGIRAAAKILLSYRERDITTISEIIKRWSPESENPTAFYINFISKASKIQKDQEVKPSDYLVILDSMIFFENGVQPYSSEVLKKGIMLA